MRASDAAVSALGLPVDIFLPPRRMELGVLHQRADDLDALPLADRQLPDLASGIERKPVSTGYFLQSRRHVLEGFLAVEAERHVFSDGEIVE